MKESEYKSNEFRCLRAPKKRSIFDIYNCLNLDNNNAPRKELFKNARPVTDRSSDAKDYRTDAAFKTLHGPRRKLYCTAQTS